MTQTNEIPSQERIAPRVVYSGDNASSVTIDPAIAAETMRELGISVDGIAHGTIYVDGKNRLVANGTHYPNKLGRLRFITNPDVRAAQGDIVRLSTQIKGKPRSEELMNRTLVHELEHYAQQDRRDPNIHAGHLAIWGLAAAGAGIGSRLGKTRPAKIASAIVGVGIGHMIGYRIAPHERQARKIAGQQPSKQPVVSTHAVRRKD